MTECVSQSAYFTPSLPTSLLPPFTYLCQALVSNDWQNLLLFDYAFLRIDCTTI